MTTFATVSGKLLTYISLQSKTKMAYNCNLPKIAKLQCGNAWYCSDTLLKIDTIKDYQGLSWTIMDYLGLSWTIMDYQGLSRTIMDYHWLLLSID